MTKPDRKTWLMLLFMLATASALLFFYMKLHIKTAYVNQEQLFNEFRLKKVLEAQFQNVENLRKQQADSLELGIRLMEKQASGQQQLLYLQQQKEFVAYKQQEFAEQNEQLKAQYNEQIFKQLNQYVGDFSREHGIDYVFGSAGDGSVLFASERFDITRELIIYVNKRFEGEAK